MNAIIPGGNWLVDPSSHGSEIRRSISSKSYVGIDFGTSTSVVSVVCLDGDGRLFVRPLNIEQPEEFGGSLHHHLVNTVLAWHREKLLFGRDAYRLRQELFEGKNVFSSFKMRLGIDIGPTYPETALRRADGGIAIENANDATREFFRLLAKGIEAALKTEGLPTDHQLVVSVPASFEANQRRDLLGNLEEAGLVASENCLIDEPNAAFLSFLLSSMSGKGQGASPWSVRLRNGTENILVYDFGAGTCDVSILEVGVEGGMLKSRNCAISRFTALGGDDFDRAIVRETLLGQLLKSAPDFSPVLRDIEERLVPRLQPVAERLKIGAIEWLDKQGITTLDELRTASTDPFEDLEVPAFKIRGSELILEKPTLTLGQLAGAMEPLVGEYDGGVSTNHVCAPVFDAIDKSGLKKEELGAVLFIGGSASNPIVRDSVMRHLPDTVEAIVPSNLRTHVSLGAALHSLGYHAFGSELIRPITPEPIYVIARDQNLEKIIPASSEVPSRDVFRTALKVDRDAQKVVELPICVGNANKLLGLVKIEAANDWGFRQNDVVTVTASITHDKLLDVEAEVDGAKVRASMLNPLANRELGPKERAMLEAKQEFNIALLDSKGSPPVEVVRRYAQAALDAKEYETAADMFVAVERLYRSEDHATTICYAYYHAGNRKKSAAWAKVAHERHPTAITAYNLSLDERGHNKETLLRQAHELDPNHTSTLLSLGKILINQNDEGKKAEGRALLEDCVRKLRLSLDLRMISKQECVVLARAAELLGDTKLAKRARDYRRKLQTSDDSQPYDEENLAGRVDKLPQPMLGVKDEDEDQ